jgi:predicted XRE-type DNA-binding protein
MKVEIFENVWDAVEGDPAKRPGLKARSELMIAVQDRLTSLRMTRAAASKRLRIPEHRLNDLIRGRFNEFDLDSLVELAARVGLDVSVTISKRI